MRLFDRRVCVSALTPTYATPVLQLRYRVYPQHLVLVSLALGGAWGVGFPRNSFPNDSLDLVLTSRLSHAARPVGRIVGRHWFPSGALDSGRSHLSNRRSSGSFPVSPLVISSPTTPLSAVWCRRRLCLRAQPTASEPIELYLPRSPERPVWVRRASPATTVEVALSQRPSGNSLLWNGHWLPVDRSVLGPRLPHESFAFGRSSLSAAQPSTGVSQDTQQENKNVSHGVWSLTAYKLRRSLCWFT